jgi:Bacterial regulatory proteins, luxR family
VKRGWPTSRELEILELVADGRSNRDAARILWVTDQTIKFHLANGDEPGSGVREPRRPIRPSRTGGAIVDPATES